MCYIASAIFFLYIMVLTLNNTDTLSKSQKPVGLFYKIFNLLNTKEYFLISRWKTRIWVYFNNSDKVIKIYVSFAIVNYSIEITQRYGWPPLKYSNAIKWQQWNWTLLNQFKIIFFFKKINIYEWFHTKYFLPDSVEPR